MSVNGKIYINLLHNHSLLQVAKQLKNSNITASELCQASLKRIEKTKTLNAFITVTKDIAYEQARESDNRFTKGNCMNRPKKIQNN